MLNVCCHTLKETLSVVSQKVHVADCVSHLHCNYSYIISLLSSSCCTLWLSSILSVSAVANSTVGLLQAVLDFVSLCLASFCCCSRSHADFTDITFKATSSPSNTEGSHTTPHHVRNLQSYVQCARGKSHHEIMQTWVIYIAGKKLQQHVQRPVQSMQKLPSGCMHAVTQPCLHAGSLPPSHARYGWHRGTQHLEIQCKRHPVYSCV